MSEITPEFTLEAHIERLVAESTDLKLVETLVRTTALPTEKLQAIIEKNTWIDREELQNALDSEDFDMSMIYDFNELEKSYLHHGISSEDFDARYEYHVDPYDSTYDPKTEQFSIMEELGFLDTGKFLISRTSQPLFILGDPDSEGKPQVKSKTAVNVVVVTPNSLLDTREGVFPDDIWKPAGVTITPSISGGYVLDFEGAFYVLNSYACDVLGIPYGEGDLAVVPVGSDRLFDYDDLVVEDSVTGSSVPLFMPLS